MKGFLIIRCKESKDGEGGLTARQVHNWMKKRRLQGKLIIAFFSLLVQGELVVVIVMLLQGELVIVIVFVTLG